MGLATPTPAAAVVHAPLALTPVPFPAGTFREAEAAAGAFAALVDAVAEDDAYLLATLRPTAAHDDFVARQLALLEATAGPRAAHRGSQGVLAHLRSDYMLHTPTGSLLQVEINTIGVSFACLGGLTACLHGHLLGRLGAGAAERAALPPNDALDQLADALGAAAQAYGVEGAVVVMVVQPGERNLYDQQVGWGGGGWVGGQRAGRGPERGQAQATAVRVSCLRALLHTPLTPPNPMQPPLHTSLPSIPLWVTTMLPSPCLPSTPPHPPPPCHSGPRRGCGSGTACARCGAR